MKCCLCHRAIVGGWYLHVFHDGKYRPAHRDCMSGAPCQLIRYQPPKRPKKKRCHLSKALRAYRKDHEGAEGT